MQIFNSRIMIEFESVCYSAVYEHWKCAENRGCYAHAANKLRQPHRLGRCNLRFVSSRKYQTNHPRPTQERKQA